MKKEEKRNAIVQKEMAKIMEKFDFDSLVTVSKVEVNERQNLANVYVSIFPFEKIEEVAKDISQQKFKIQKEFNKCELKKKPRLNFFVDPQAEQADTLRKLGM